jgi:hypothetical protein
MRASDDATRTSRNSIHRGVLVLPITRLQVGRHNLRRALWPPDNVRARTIQVAVKKTDGLKLLLIAVLLAVVLALLVAILAPG